MEAAKAAVNKITGRHGHHTEVDEHVVPAVTSETVKPHQHQEVQEAVDREVHQDHYHTTVQPIAHKETLPEKHKHNLGAQVEREFRHDNEADTHRRIQAEHGQFQNTSTVRETTQSQSAAPAVVGEHVHHHVHEKVQPVIHKETIQPEVVHTTVPIHETHHASSQHHGLSALPTKTLDEFTKAGGVLSGHKTHTHEEYDGAPRPYNEKFATTIEKVLPGHHSTPHNTSGTTRPDSGAAGFGNHAQTKPNGTDRMNPGVDTDRDGRIGTTQPDSGVTGVGNHAHTKANMADRLNPRVDADRDGRTGVMD